MPDSVSMLLILFVVVAIIFASVFVMIFSRLNGVEETLDVYREEYVAIKHRLYRIEKELYKLRDERSGSWVFKTETISTSAPKQETEPNTSEKEDEASNDRTTKD